MVVYIHVGIYVIMEWVRGEMWSDVRSGDKR